MSESNKLVQGVGLNDGKYITRKDGRNIKEYNLWNSMLERCSDNLRKKRPTYMGTTCSDNFKLYSFFYEWCQTQVGFGEEDENGKRWHLDKDILFKGNKCYSEDTCAFVPQRINCMLVKCNAARGEWPVGVCWDRSCKKFVSQCNDTGKNKHLGYFNTPQEAFQAYKTFKESLIKEVANEYKNQLDPRVYEALMNYEVNEND